MTTGYSGTPLARKLSLKDGMRVWWEEMPSSVRAEIEDYGLDLRHLIWHEAPIDAVHVFVTSRDELESALEDWLLLRLSRQLPVSVIDGIDLTVSEVA